MEKKVGISDFREPVFCLLCFPSFSSCFAEVARWRVGIGGGGGAWYTVRQAVTKRAVQNLLTGNDPI